MSWGIASIPVWILGAFFLAAAPISIWKWEPGETGAQVGGQFISSLILSSLFFSIAAWIVS